MTTFEKEGSDTESRECQTNISVKTVTFREDETDVRPSPRASHSPVKSVTFAPLESTRISEENFISDLLEIDDYHYRDSTQESREFVKISDLEPGIITGNVPRESSHEKSKNKSDIKVTFCDTPNEVTSKPRPDSPVTEVILVTDPLPGIWPLKRSVSLESRDNPFMPDGDLSKEAEDILKRATIIRDTFILNDKTSEVKQSDNCNLEDEESKVIEEEISATTVNENQSSPVKNQPKQNGKLEDKGVSPDSVKLEGETNNIDFNSKDKKKQQKCCSLM